MTPTGPRPKFTQQNNETDWEFLWRLADLYDYEVVVEDGSCSSARPAAPVAATVRLDWARSRPMLISLRPRVTGVQQIKDVKVRGWDGGKKPIISTASVGSIASRIGIDRSQIVRALGGGT